MVLRLIVPAYGGRRQEMAVGIAYPQSGKVVVASRDGGSGDIGWPPLPTGLRPRHHRGSIGVLMEVKG